MPKLCEQTKIGYIVPFIQKPNSIGLECGNGIAMDFPICHIIGTYEENRGLYTFTYFFGRAYIIFRVQRSMNSSIMKIIRSAGMNNDHSIFVFE